MLCIWVQSVIARLDQAIQKKALDSPVKPENDGFFLNLDTLQFAAGVFILRNKNIFAEKERYLKIICVFHSFSWFFDF